MSGTQPPRIIAHRGASGHAHENSPAAFRKARELGANAVELDVHGTRDGVLLVHHDPGVPGVGRFADLPVEAFNKYRLPNGEGLPTLAEALEICHGMDVWVEVKALLPSHDERLLKTLAEGPDPDCYAVHSFDHRIIARLGEAEPELRRGVLLSSYLIDTLFALNAAGADTLWMETHLIDQELVELVHEDAIRLIAWTANDEREIERLIQLGVDGICGNYPDRIGAVLARTGAGR
jgi:glycerophosphoryl diester phosphodiesterase